ncbi:MAG: SCP2 sterol-binding domain-containing protein [Polyangiaceae bacterium]|nr:SCP2 sterol-binding domain-containing protein [Polyangiaceae bacterium]
MATVQKLMDDARNKLEANTALAAQIGAVFKFVLSGAEGGTFIWRLQDPPSITEGDGEAACTITMSADDYVAMRQGRANAQELFFAQRLRVDGDLGLAMKLQALNELVG